MKDNTVRNATRTLVAWMVLCTLAIVSPAAWAVIIGALPYTLTNGTTADATHVMANYQKIIDDVNANAAARGANSDITSLSGLTTPLSAAQGGSNHYYGGTSAGSANAQTVATLTPIGFALTSGYSATFTAGFTNTGATTLSLNGTAATNVFKRTALGTSALSGGEIVLGQKVSVSYDGTRYQLMTPVDASFGARTDIASAGTTDLGTVTTRFANITGTTTITAFGSSAVTAYPIYKLRFAGSLTLTHNGTSLILPGAANIQTQANDSAWATYLGSGNWQVLDYQRGGVYPQTGQLARVNIYVANDTWTKGTDERSVRFECAGGGGAGGGAEDTGAGEHSGGSGGGAGGYAVRYITSPAASYALTIGAGGTGVSDANGGNGGNTTVGAVLTCNGGTGGIRRSSTTNAGSEDGGAGGTAASGDQNVTGGRGGGYIGNGNNGISADPWSRSGEGGSNRLAAGATGGAADEGNATVNAGQACGGGGAGAAAASGGGSAAAGSNGGVGCVIAYTYY